MQNNLGHKYERKVKQIEEKKQKLSVTGGGVYITCYKRKMVKPKVLGKTCNGRSRNCYLITTEIHKEIFTEFYKLSNLH